MADLSDDPGKEVDLRDGGTFLVSEQDYDMIASRTWHLDLKGYPVSVYGKQWKRVHQVIMGEYMGPPTGYSRMEVDHVNEIKTDNRRSNLQWLTPSEHRKKTRRMEQLGLAEPWDRRKEERDRAERVRSRLH